MHKNPVKFRFIIGSKSSILKPIAKKLVDILKLVMKTLKRYYEKVEFYTGINRYWIVGNSDIPIRHMEKLNLSKKGRNVECFDFSTLYTKIPHEELKQILKMIVAKAFRGGTNQYISITKSGANWRKNAQENCFSRERIYLMIDKIVDNSFFKFGEQVVLQKIGIPMGIDPAPQMANLYLHSYEADFMEKLAKEDYRKAIKFNKTCRFIDDLETLNNDGILNEMKNRIYPVELTCNKENVGDKSATFLEMDISVINGRFKIKTYDKRDSYNFEIVNYPDLSGNVPIHAAYGVFTSQMIRYGRICTHFQDFLDRCKLLCDKLCKKGFKKERLEKTARKFIHRYPWILHKYGQQGFLSNYLYELIMN